MPKEKGWFNKGMKNCSDHEEKGLKGSFSENFKSTDASDKRTTAKRK